MKKIKRWIIAVLLVAVVGVWGYGTGRDQVETLSDIGAKEENVIIVLDPGHGGMDGGASAPDGTQEKNINLDIALYLKEEMSRYPVKVIMTRENDEGLYVDDNRSIREKKREDLVNRKKLIEESGCTLAVLIHLNSFADDASIYGAQVFYPKCQSKRTEGRTEEQSSKTFAESVQKSLEINIQDGRERTAMAKNDILIFEDAAARMILVECGFLSNPKEAAMLKTAKYQRILSDAIWKGINEILCLEKCNNMEVVDSTNKHK